MLDTDFVLEGAKWGSSDLGTAGGTVTWAVDSSIPQAELASIKAAFAEWSEVANIQFQEVASTANADIDFKNGAIDGAGSILGQTGFSFSGGQLQHADVEFDSGDTFSSSQLTLVAAHEIGHAIGLGHFDSAPAVMNSVANFSLTGLAQSDIDGIQAIYGANTATTADGGTTPTPADPGADNGTGNPGTSGTPTPGSTGTNADGGTAGGCGGTATASNDGGTGTSAAAGAGTDDGGSHHRHGGDHGGQFADIAALLHSIQGDHDGPVAALANEAHHALPVELSNLSHAHFEHMWT